MDPGSVTLSPIAANVSASAEMVTFILNATLSFQESFASATGNRSLEGGALALLFLGFFASSLNTWLMVVICTHSCLKKSLTNYFLKNLALPCLLESIFAIPVSWNHYSTQSPWKWKVTVCCFDAFMLLLVSLVIMCFLVAMCTEQYVASKRPSHTKNQFGDCKQRIMTALIWTAGFSVTLPVILGSQDVRAFPSRLGCAISENRCGVFLMEFTFVFVLPLFSALFVLLTSWMRLRSRRVVLIKQRKDFTFTEFFFEDSYLRNRLTDSKFCGVLMFLYITLHFPYIANQMYFPIRVCFSPLDTASGNATLSDSLLVTPIACTFETYLTWIRYSFSLAFPLTTLILRKDIRRRNVLIFGCCMSSSSRKRTEVETIESNEQTEKTSSEEKTRRTGKKRKRKEDSDLSQQSSQDAFKYIMNITPHILFPFKKPFFSRYGYFFSRPNYERYAEDADQVTSFGDENRSHPQTYDVSDDDDDADDELDSKEYASVSKAIVRNSSGRALSVSTPGPSTIKLDAWGSEEDSCEDIEHYCDGRLHSSRAQNRTTHEKLHDRRSSLPAFLSGGTRKFRSNPSSNGSAKVPVPLSAEYLTTNNNSYPSKTKINESLANSTSDQRNPSCISEESASKEIEN